MEFTEAVRPIGSLWILAEASPDFGGQPYTYLMTLGYDPTQKAFVGTWVDTMQTHLWRYRGTLDASGKILTLMTEGPAFGDPNQIIEYRDVIRVKSRDHRIFTSQTLGQDGEWLTFMTAEYRRKR